MLALVAAAVGAGTLLLLPALLLLDWFTGARVLVALTLILLLLSAPLIHSVAAVATGRVRSPAVAFGRSGWPAAAAPALALFLSGAAVFATARSFDPGNIVAAQRNTLPYALKQPVAFALFVLSLAMLARAVAGDGRAPRVGRAVVLMTGGLLTTALFLAGGAGPVLPPAAWLLLKTVGAALVAALVFRATSPLITSSLHHLITSIISLVSMVNLVATIWLTR